MTMSDYDSIKVEVSLTDIEVVNDGFHQIAEALEDIADDADPDVREQLYDVMDELYRYLEVIDDE